MRITLAVLVGIVALLLPGTAAAAPPANDDFANATAIDPSLLPYNASVNNTEATTEPGEPLQCVSPPPVKTVWYSITPTADMVLRADTGGSNFSTTLLVLQANGPGFGGLSGLQCQLFGNPAIFSASAGTTYYLQAAAFPFDFGGDLHLNVQEIPPPPNDDFADATEVHLLGYSNVVDTTAADTQPGEPVPSCAFGSVSGSVWYRFTPSVDGSVSARASGNLTGVVAAYTGNAVNSLSEMGCRNFSGLLTMHVDAGTTYYFQAGGMFGQKGSLQFTIEVTPPPVAGISLNPGDPSVFDTVQFFSNSFDPGEIGIESMAWTFGDGGAATGCCPTHRYLADGNYTVGLIVTTFDGRTASTETMLQVRTHDVTITKMQVPNSGNVGQTRQITVGLSNKRYGETVQMQLYKSGPNGFEFVGTLVQSVPVRSGGRTTDFKFSYTFTSADAVLGKVTFKAVAQLVSARDAVLADNEAISLPTKVNG